MSDLFITNGLVIDPARGVREKSNCYIQNGRVREWTKSAAVPAGVPCLDAQGAIVAPGFLDIHVHLREPGQEYKEDIASGSAAAVAGGFTTIVCMANTDPVNDTAAVTRYMLERAAAVNLCRVYPLGSISRGLKGKSLADIGDLAEAGAVGISDDGKTVVDSLLMRRAMEYARDFALPVIVHSEDPALCCDTAMHEGAVSTRLGLGGRPSASEYIMIARDIALAQLTGCPLHLQHLSCRESVDAVRRAKAAKLPVTAEATPHHLLLTDEALATFDPHMKMNPPLRTAADRSALRKGIKDGTIDAIATDHAPHAVTEKAEMPIETAAAGVIGLETALPVCLKLVEDRVISMTRFVELFTHGPARALKLAHGRLAVGDPGDVTIFDPKRRVTLSAQHFASKSRNTPFEGWTCAGKVMATVVGGRVVYEG
jgi:dihydroorotase